MRGAETAQRLPRGPWGCSPAGATTAQTRAVVPAEGRWTGSWLGSFAALTAPLPPQSWAENGPHGDPHGDSPGCEVSGHQATSMVFLRSHVGLLVIGIG